MESLFISDTIIFFFKYKFNLNEEYTMYNVILSEIS